MAEQEQTAMDWFPTDKEFVVELRFLKPNEKTAANLISILMGKRELLPDLIIEKIHCQAHSVAQKGSEDLLDGVKEAFLEFERKVIKLRDQDWNKRLGCSGESPDGSVVTIGGYRK